ARDLWREGDAQAPPRLAVLSPRRDLIGDEPGKSEQKRSRQIGPKGVAIEVSTVQNIPGILYPLALGMGPRVESLTHDGSVRLQHRNARRRKLGTSIWAAEGRDGSPLVLRGDFHLTRRRVLRGTFHGPQLSSADDGCMHHVECVPLIEAAVRVQDSAQKLVHFALRSRRSIRPTVVALEVPCCLRNENQALKNSFACFRNNPACWYWAP